MEDWWFEGTGKSCKPETTFGQCLNKCIKAAHMDLPLKKRPRSPPRWDRPSSPRWESSNRLDVVTTLFPPQKMYATMPWTSPVSNSFLFIFPFLLHTNMNIYQLFYFSSILFFISFFFLLIVILSVSVTFLYSSFSYFLFFFFFISYYI